MNPPKDLQMAGGLSLVAAILNLINSGLWILIWIWVCVGVLWVIPFCVALGQLYCGVMCLQGKRVPNARILNIVGAINSLFLLNVLGLGLEIFAFVVNGKEEMQAWHNGSD